MDDRLLKPYSPKDTEERTYALWNDSGYFNPDTCARDGFVDDAKPPFSMMLPPPNVTGTLHMGHAAMLVIEDILARYARMQGRRTLWLPGTDHAAIATQSKVEGIIAKEEGKNRHDLGREELLRRVEQFAQESHDTIVGQVRAMGSSVDWSREAFTLDDARNRAVRTAFKKMYDDGLIYRGYRVVNWDPKGQTTVSDEEVVYREETGVLYTFRYAKDFPISVATTRPETKVGDTAVAVHPDDVRYQKYIGQTFAVTFAGVPLSIKIVGDLAVDPLFGTGAVGVTPAHSMTDFEIGKRHDLPVIPVINEYSKMSVESELVQGKKVKEARALIVEWLKSQGLLEKEEALQQNIPVAERTGGVIEQLPKLQWFVNVRKEFTLAHSTIEGIPSGSTTTLKDLMRTVVENGQIEILPNRFAKIYFHWINNLNDWCISRQIWYGHRIPVWYRGEGKDQEIYAGIEAPEGENWEQDPDTLDTWFSSGLWTFSTLGWPDQTEDLKRFHPTSVIETGYDILFFWVARMILMSGYLLGEPPFKTVYMHGLVRDSKGRKMSKSLGNIIDPLTMIEKYGADAARMSLIVGAPAGNDTNLSEDKIRAYKLFANKLWNVARFVLTNTEGTDLSSAPQLTERDTEILLELDRVTKETSEHIDAFRLHLAAEGLYHYVWHTFADIIIEESKKRIMEGASDDAAATRFVLYRILKTTLTLLHPFMPFETEELWGIMQSAHPEAHTSGTDRILMVSPWPYR